MGGIALGFTEMYERFLKRTAGLTLSVTPPIADFDEIQTKLAARPRAQAGGGDVMTRDFDRFCWTRRKEEQL